MPLSMIRGIPFIFFLLMSSISKIQFGDNDFKRYSSEYRITDCKCSFNRSFDCCLPHADAKCESIEVSVVAPGMTDLNLVEWFIYNSVLSGRIMFDLSGDLNSDEDFVQEIYFENAYCASLSENYDIESNMQRLLSLVIIPTTVTVFDVCFPRPE